MDQLHHNGVLVPSKYEERDLSIKINGVEHRLDDLQEEMAMAWAKKIGTPYVEDHVFQSNFHADLSKEGPSRQRFW